MAWIAVDKDGTENIFQYRPRRSNTEFIPLYTFSMCLALPKGSIRKLIGKELKWEDEPVELIKD